MKHLFLTAVLAGSYFFASASCAAVVTLKFDLTLGWETAGWSDEWGETAVYQVTIDTQSPSNSSAEDVANGTSTYLYSVLSYDLSTTQSGVNYRYAGDTDGVNGIEVQSDAFADGFFIAATNLTGSTVSHSISANVSVYFLDTSVFNSVALSELENVTSINANLAFAIDDYATFGVSGDLENRATWYEIDRVSIVPNPVPLPASVFLFGTAIAGLLALNFKRRPPSYSLQQSQ